MGDFLPDLDALTPFLQTFGFPVFIGVVLLLAFLWAIRQFIQVAREFVGAAKEFAAASVTMTANHKDALEVSAREQGRAIREAAIINAEALDKASETTDRIVGAIFDAFDIGRGGLATRRDQIRQGATDDHPHVRRKTDQKDQS